jgi:hypothetical protein
MIDVASEVVYRIEVDQRKKYWVDEMAYNSSRRWAVESLS